jgi:protocatechuate 3,4-dioxygenase beta subunit
VDRGLSDAPRLFPTGSSTIGPFFPAELAIGMNDLTRRKPEGPVAQGQLVLLSGRVLQEGGRPVVNFLVEIWQADAKGRFDHPADRRNEEVDVNFAFWGRALTDAEGRYSFRTIKPGPVPAADGAASAPHIAVTLLGSGLMRRLVTRMYFPDDPRNAADPLLRRIGDPAVASRLLARPHPQSDTARDALALIFDVVLRGEGETPFLAD